MEVNADIDMDKFVQALAERLKCDADPDSILAALDASKESLGDDSHQESLGRTMAQGFLKQLEDVRRQEAFKALSSSIAAETDAEVIGQLQLTVPENLHDRMVLFLKTWGTLPPLVRASVASNIAYIVADTAARSEQRALSLLMPRRRAVERNFQIGYIEIRDLLIALCNAADHEAIASGIDLDTRTALAAEPK